jgi:hypothetical protein
MADPTRNRMEAEEFDAQLQVVCRAVADLSLSSAENSSRALRAGVLPPVAPPPPPPLMVPALRECCVCLDDVLVADLLLLLPCAHRCVCAACAAALLAEARPCPKCREPVARASRVFED